MAGTNFVFGSSRGVERIHLALRARENNNYREYMLNFNLLDCNVHVQTLFSLRFPRLGSFARKMGSFAQNASRASVSLTMCLGSFCQNVCARVRSADLPVERNHSPQAEVRVGRIGTCSWFVHSGDSTTKQPDSTRSRSRCRMLPNAVAGMSAARRGLSGPDVASLIRARSLRALP